MKDTVHYTVSDFTVPILFPTFVLETSFSVEVCFNTEGCFICKELGQFSKTIFKFGHVLEDLPASDIISSFCHR